MCMGLKKIYLLKKQHLKLIVEKKLILTWFVTLVGTAAFTTIAVGLASTHTATFAFFFKNKKN